MTQPSPLSLHADAPWNTPASQLHLEQITAARALGAKIRRAVVVATLSGWTLGIFAALSIVTGLMHIPSFLLGLGMAIVAFYELRGAGEIKRLDITAPKRLAINQIALGGMLLLYAAYVLFATLHQATVLPAAVASDPQITQMLGPIEELSRMIYIAMYATLMLLAVLGPGLTACYYHTRGKHIARYIQQAPPWILQLQRAGLSV